MRCLDDEAAALVFSGGLSAEERTAIDAHVDTCADCFALLASLAESFTPAPAAAGEEDVPGALKRGARIGRYVLVEQIGAGGMGNVFSAEDPALARTVAIKIVRTSLRSERSNQDLLAEARLMAQLSHPNIVPVFDAGTEGEAVFLAMELVDGQNLREWLATQKPNAREIERVLVEAGKGLAAAHRAGIVHRDFKPDNVLVGKDGRVVVTDFGLAHSAVVASDRIAGTLEYMAPEQKNGKTADARSDQYSFGVTLGEALGGTREVGKAHLPPRLAKIVTRATAADPTARFPTMDALLAGFARSRPLWALLALPIAAFAVMFVFVKDKHDCAVPADALEGVWDEPRQDNVRRALGGAAGNWPAVANTVNAYVAQWSAMRVEACEATFVKKTQSHELHDLRQACLEERLAELRAATTVFATADSRVALNAPTAAKALTPVAACADTRALLAIKPPPPEVAVEVATLRQDLARAKALRDSGKLPEALKNLRIAAADAERAKYDPVAAATLLQLGDAELANGDAARADATLALAATTADRARDDATRARALTRQVYAVGYALEDFARVPPIDAQIESVIARLGGDDELEGDRLQAIGMIALAQHDTKTADEVLSRAVSLREKHFGPRGRRVAMSRQSHCLVLAEDKKWDAALAECTLARDIWKESLGDRHPDVSLALKNIGHVELELGRVDDGCRDIEESLSIETATLEPDHPTIAGTLLFLADCRDARGDHEGALVSAQRALAIRQTKLGPNHARTREALRAVAAREKP